MDIAVFMIVAFTFGFMIGLLPQSQEKVCHPDAITAGMAGPSFEPQIQEWIEPMTGNDDPESAYSWQAEKGMSSATEE